jgi:hypothetical protein
MQLNLIETYYKKMNNIQVYIHVGYPKNASTTLQMDIFPNIPGVIYFGRRYDLATAFSSKELESAIHSISYEDSIGYDADNVRARITRALNKTVSMNNRKVLISWEAFMHNVADRGLIATRLKDLFPNAKILFVIRNQLDSIESMYHFLVVQAGGNINPSYGRPSVRSLTAWISDQDNFSYRSYLETLKYDEIYSLYVKLFSVKNVKVLLFEDMKDSPQMFLNEIANFFGLSSISISLMQKRNSRPSSLMSKAFKFRNMLRDIGFRFAVPKIISRPTKKILSLMGGLFKFDKLTDVQRNILSERYKQSNSKLQGLIKKDLKSKNYPILSIAEVGSEEI